MTQLPILDQSASPATSCKSSGESKGSYSFVSLGCPKNLVDSERMLGLLQIDGYSLVQEPVGADFVVVNTCGFIEAARTESFAAIHEMLELKRQGKIRGVVVCGCLAERQKEQLLIDCPEIDQVVGVFGREEITKVADRLVGNLDEQREVFRPAPVRALEDRHRLRITPKHFAYLKVSEGCDRLCTFCAIPKMRGKHATKPMEEVIREAEELAADGVRELIVVAQDTTYYGLDLYGEPRLAQLLKQLNEVKGFDWIRLMYFYPMYIDDHLLQTIADADKIVPYIDMPLQHINDNMLRRMSRRVTRSSTEDTIARMRKFIPDLAIRTTFITGFPGETDEQFDELCGFVAEQKFERVGVFTYSREEGTPAVKLPDALPEEVAAERRDRLMEVQQNVVFDRNDALVGTTMDVILDQQVPGQATAWIGRTKHDAPDVDCVVFVSGEGLAAGQIVPTEIVATHEYDLIGAAVDTPR
ncbi:30S ribosomal protein S12 methylthiotransferase RimO [Blastopirellula sp. J2-11]|uniref:30S ribosomal protein S12 methylthiotransferase RimO n=1 Tax=Blastopirellula sp. J2-11 TaxID=2943192 RepID=UPI0021C91CF0|nr:30S ribosomal protein S12 methylthiotransferase RimO [Blastopirellula sp. J2-11]UUO09091.1 30S ribosomal protein S12 methylthiotransferase RimO [Blastopirellula sp. J2-11]